MAGPKKGLYLLTPSILSIINKLMFLIHTCKGDITPIQTTCTCSCWTQKNTGCYILLFPERLCQRSAYSFMYSLNNFSQNSCINYSIINEYFNLKNKTKYFRGV